MKSKESMNQLNEKTQFRHKGKPRLGYIEENHLSKELKRKKGLHVIIMES